MPFDAADIAAFFDPDMPGYAVATFSGGVTVAGLFVNNYATAFGLVGGSRPALTVSAAALPSVAIGDAVAINSTDYAIAEIQPRSAGVLVMMLEKS